jgi:hypothetical protein
LADTRIAKILFVTLICCLGVLADPFESVLPVLTEDPSRTALQSTDGDEEDICEILDDSEGEAGSISPDTMNGI